MKTTYRTMALESGQALAIDRHRSANLFLAEGEVLLQGPAEWLAGTVVMAAPRRVAAPAALASAGIASITAVGAAKIVVEEAASLLDPVNAAWNLLFRLTPLGGVVRWPTWISTSNAIPDRQGQLNRP